MRSYEASIEKRVSALIDDVAVRDRFGLVNDVAAPLPTPARRAAAGPAAAGGTAGAAVGSVRGPASLGAIPGAA